MQKLRSLHLYLGCIFAPMLFFFAISGIWQMIGTHASVLRWLSAIHTSARFKNGHEPGSPALKFFVLLMAASFILTLILGVVMALKYGKSRKIAIYCLAIGVIIPAVLVLLKTYG